jgi:hypothetical protein
MLRYLYIGKIWLIVKKVGLLFSMMSQSAREVGSLPQSEALSVFSKALCASKKTWIAVFLVLFKTLQSIDQGNAG